MRVKRDETVPADAIEGSPGATIRWLWAEKDGAPNFALRLIEVQPGASTPHHAHPYEHEAYVLSGRGRLLDDGHEHALEVGDTVLVMPDEMHQFVNAGPDVLRFLCLIPLKRDSTS
jgi:quercetin dioxygenase-like cupin family protein